MALLFAAPATPALLAATPASLTAPARTSAAMLVPLVLLLLLPIAVRSAAGGSSAAPDGFFMRHPDSTVAPLGDEVALKCVLRFAAERILWRKDGVVLHDTNGVGANGGTVRSSERKVKLKERSQAGVYQCVAYFGVAARASLPGRVSLAELSPFPPVRTMLERSFTVPEGSTVPLRWLLPRGNPPPVLEFQKDGQPIPESWSRFRVQEASGALLVVNVTKADAGVYSCAASNYITGQRVHSPVNITLKVTPLEQSASALPYFLSPSPPEAYNVSLGSNVTLECAGAGMPIPAVTVHKYGGAVPSDRATLTPAGLRLTFAKPSDTGTYMCELLNVKGRSMHVIKLSVQEPPDIGRLPNMTTIQEGDDAGFECVAKGSPRPQVTWLFNGERVEPADDVRLNGSEREENVQVSQLSLRGAGRRRAGTYQCFASNAVGDAVRSLMLHVAPQQIPPGAASTPVPPPGTRSSGHGAPLDEDGDEESSEAAGGGGVDGVEERGGGHGRRRRPQHHRTGGRQRDKGRHRGGGGGGGGGAGGSDTMIPPSKPMVTRLSDTSVMVRWDVPSNEGLPILFFKVQYREAGKAQKKRGNGGGGRLRGAGGLGVGGGGPDRRAGEGSRWMTHEEDISEHRRSLKVDNLLPDHMYRFRVAAVYVNNDNKPGPISDRFLLLRGEVGNDLAVPKLQKVTPLSPSSLKITWTYFGSSSVQTQGFYVYYRPASTAGEYLQVTVDGEKERQFIIQHLEPNTAYEVKVQSFNINTASNFSAIMSQKTLPAPTEEPPTEAIGPTSGQSEPVKGSMFTVMIAVLGGLAVLGTVLAAIFLCRRRRLQAGSHQDKGNDPGLQGDAATVFALNSKTILNGRLPQNGHHTTNKINITTNPLAESDEDKNQNVVEMSSQNNNRSSTTGSSSGVARNSTASDAEADTHIDCDSAPTDVHNWRGIPATGVASEKYV